ncbi:MAG: hypothetical protein R8K22_06325 [Mariprofundaceae bacterium]
MTPLLADVMNSYLDQGIDPASKEKELWKEFGETHAILVIDSSGFTRTTNKFGAVYFLSKLTQKRNITLPIIKEHRCSKHITEADNLLALFPTTQLAFDAALAIEAEIRKSKLMLDKDDPFRISVGIGFGELLVTGGHGEFFGPEINIASKLGEDTAKAGELMVTERAFERLSDDVQKHFSKAQIQASGNDITCYVMTM